MCQGGAQVIISWAPLKTLGLARSLHFPTDGRTSNQRLLEKTGLWVERNMAADAGRMAGNCELGDGPFEPIGTNASGVGVHAGCRPGDCFIKWQRERTGEAGKALVEMEKELEDPAEAWIDLVTACAEPDHVVRRQRVEELLQKARGSQWTKGLWIELTTMEDAEYGGSVSEDEEVDITGDTDDDHFGSSDEDAVWQLKGLKQ